ncbi:hypothetical protein WL10_28160 [Burkholderia ubonensis]|uniref:HamA C-terminal domain-containing protein n=1 Tax=Burkholderia ubonensis TaxID=101571 RepID=UPI0007609812|nr:DUF1837 domain-containing protein [Burkholderia ubonensis]KVX99490.1 hypothetical protein WL10_28160 [Burkholderia ubonensis]MDN7845958.1 DUF1837 domain-containing protein [Burkholderia multivorans]
MNKKPSVSGSEVAKHIRRLVGRHLVDERIRRLTVDAGDDVEFNAYFLYPAFRNGKPTVGPLVEMLMGEITAFCIAKEERRKAKLADKNLPYDSPAMDRLARSARKLFMSVRQNHSRSGEGGELLLFVLIEHFLNAPIVLSKMRLKTSANMPVHGTDGVHAFWDDEKNTLVTVFGESKFHKTFDSAVADAAASLEDFVNNVNGRYDHELLLTSHHIDLDGFPSRIKEHLLKFLNPFETEEGNQRLERFAILLGFDAKQYNQVASLRLDEAEEKFRQLYESVVKDAIQKASSKLSKGGIALSSVDLFMFPIPSVDDFRTKFERALCE